MVRAVKQIVTVQSGGRVEVTSDRLPEGHRAEVIILLDTPCTPPDTIPSCEVESVRPPIWTVAQELMRDLSADELDNLPSDLAAEHDHYVYGSPKRYP